MINACGSLSLASCPRTPTLFAKASLIRSCVGPLAHGVVLAVGMLFVLSSGSPAYGQDGAAEEFAEFAEVAEVEEAPVDAGAADAPVDGGGDTAAGTAKKKTLLGWVYESLGLGYLFVFLALSVSLVSLFVMNVLAARRDTLCPQELVDSFEEKLNEKDFQGAYDMARTDESVLGQVLSAGLAKLSRGYNKAIEGMQEVGEEESMKLEHRLSYMALIGNLSPMIGLFGTVHGMISSFQVIAVSEATPKPAELAEGISTALFTTLIGLAVAIPAIAAYNLLRNRVSRLLLEVGVTSENLMSRFEDVQPQGAKK